VIDDIKPITETLWRKIVLQWELTAEERQTWDRFVKETERYFASASTSKGVE
jgi:hypothetical protein